MKIKPMIYQTDRKTELLHSDKYKEYKYYILNLGTHPTAYMRYQKAMCYMKKIITKYMMKDMI